MPEKSKIMFENAGPPEERFKYSFCEVREQEHVNMTKIIENIDGGFKNVKLGNQY